MQHAHGAVSAPSDIFDTRPSSKIIVTKDVLKAKKLKKKAISVEVYVHMFKGSSGPMTIENITEDKSLAKKVVIDNNEGTITFMKNAKRGIYTFRITVAEDKMYKETVEEFTITVK